MLAGIAWCKRTRIDATQAIGTCCLLSVLSACGGLPHDAKVDLTYPQEINVEYLSALRVIVQVCVPDRTVSLAPIDLDLTKVPVPPPWTTGVISVPGGVSDTKEMLAARRVYLSKIAAHSIPDSRTVAHLMQFVADVRETDITKPYATYGNVEHKGDLGSEGVGSINLRGRTTAEQPVYELSTKTRPEFLTAISFRAPYRTGTKYWYKLPDHIPHKAFTEWLAPFAEDDRASETKGKQDIGYKLVYRGKVTPTKTDAFAPKIRYKLMSVVEEYEYEGRFWNRTQKAINAYKLSQNLRSDSEGWANLHFVPAEKIALPPC